MLDASKPVAFIATANPDKAEKFYEEVLGLRKLENTPFSVVFDANGIILRVQKVESLTPQPYTVLGWEVSDIVSTVQWLAGRGVSPERFNNLSQNDLGIWVTPDGSGVVWFRDPDNNTLSLTQNSFL